MALVGGDSAEYNDFEGESSESGADMNAMTGARASQSQGGGRPGGSTIRRRAEFPLQEGLATLEVPFSISQQSYDDLKEWIDLVLRQAERSIKSDSE